MGNKEVTKQTKKERILALDEEGLSVEQIAEMLQTTPSYVVNVLTDAGRYVGYTDLYVTTAAQTSYAKMLRGVLRFKDVASARASVERIDAIYHEFERLRDHRGMHQAQVTALIGKNRAEGIGKYEEAQVFADWLKEHLEVWRPESHESRQRVGTRAAARAS